LMPGLVARPRSFVTVASAEQERKGESGSWFRAHTMHTQRVPRCQASKVLP
jgi:hypothetical protein